MTLFSASTAAHTQGVSVANVSLQEDGTARLELGLATAEIARIVPIDSDKDGLASGPELAAVQNSIAKIFPGTFDLVADGKRCPATFESVKLAEPTDGVDIVVRFTCARRPQDVTFRSHLAPAMAPGHRLVATVATPGRTQSRVLGSSEPECVLHTEWELDTRSSARWQYGIAASVLAMLGLAYAWTQRRKRR